MSWTAPSRAAEASARAAFPAAADRAKNAKKHESSGPLGDGAFVCGLSKREEESIAEARRAQRKKRACRCGADVGQNAKIAQKKGWLCCGWERCRRSRRGRASPRFRVRQKIAAASRTKSGDNIGQTAKKQRGQPEKTHIGKVIQKQAARGRPQGTDCRRQTTRDRLQEAGCKRQTARGKLQSAQTHKKPCTQTKAHTASRIQRQKAIALHIAVTVPHIFCAGPDARTRQGTPIFGGPPFPAPPPAGVAMRY